MGGTREREREREAQRHRDTETQRHRETHDWTVKVEPESVFLPDRFRRWAAKHHL